MDGARFHPLRVGEAGGRLLHTGSMSSINRRYDAAQSVTAITSLDRETDVDGCRGFLPSRFE
jgi:hypothetical protein